MMKYYEISFSAVHIREIEVESETKGYVTIKGRDRWKKDSDYYAFRPTPEEAKKCLITRITQEIEGAEKTVGYFRDKLKKAEAL